MKRLAISLMMLPVLPALVACSVTPQAAPADPVGQAIVTPFSDLNLVRAAVPAALIAALKAPYARPAEAGCASLLAEVQALDAALGPDLDVPPSAANPGLIERGGDAATHALRGAAEGIIPFRGWVRKLSGAERNSRELAAAIAAGTVRRSFLKGLGAAAACEPPAAPRRASEAQR